MVTKILQKIKYLILHNNFPIITLICINLVIGAFVVKDYGESWDEKPRYRYAENSINAYKGILIDVEDEKGPFFVMTATLGGNLICSFQDDCSISDVRHYINFLSFLLGLFFLYRLNNRFVNKWAAFGGTLLFNTQPLLWGHAFINPKDLPFMAFFIASIDTGFAIADTLSYPITVRKIKCSNNQNHSIRSRFHTDLKSKSVPKILSLIITSAIVICIIAGFRYFQDSAHLYIKEFIQDVYANNAHSFLNTIFKRSAQYMNDIPVENYIHKAWQIYLRGVKYLSIFLIILWFFVTFAIIFSDTIRYLWNNQIKSLIKGFRKKINILEVKHLLIIMWENVKNPKIIIAGVFLGLTCSIRTLGPAAGGLIGLYLVIKFRKNALSTLVSYFIIGIITTYITWPGLWQNPIQSFLDSFLLASDFPWGGEVLFAGRTYYPGTQPRTYLPVLLSIQFTFSALITIILGIILSIVKLIQRKLDWMKLLILYLWFFVPFTLIIILEPKIYDNFRHFLFIIPPLFTLSTISIQSIFDYFKRPVAKALFILLLIIPNIFPLTKLHPYQYIYYNDFTNGLQGAFRKYEMDYWGTSFQEATEFINQTAPLKAKIIVSGPAHIVETYARTDLEIINFKRGMVINIDSPAYAILLSRYNKDILLFPETATIYSVGRDDAIFTVVKYIQTSELK